MLQLLKGCINVFNLVALEIPIFFVCPSEDENLSFKELLVKNY